MELIIETFHVDVKLLLAQMINFAIVFCILYFFALKPLMKVLAERSKKIEKSLKDAKEIENKLVNTEEEYKKAIAEAKKEANEIMEKAIAQAEEKKQEAVKKAKEEIGAVINQEKAKMQSEKEKTLKEIKKEVVDLVILSMEKVLDEKIDKKKDEEIIKKTLK